MISPVNGTPLTGTSQTFTWTNTGAVSYQLYVGSTPGGYDIGIYQRGTGTTANVTSLPTNGSTIYVTLWSRFGTTWYSNAYTYTAAVGVAATITSPANASTLSGSSQTFTWTNTGAASYQIYVGSTPGGYDIGIYQRGTGTTANVTSLPINGSTIYVTLWSRFGSTWYSNVYTYTSGR
jgi:hypothetical protein